MSLTLVAPSPFSLNTVAAASSSRCRRCSSPAVASRRALLRRCEMDLEPTSGSTSSTSPRFCLPMEVTVDGRCTPWRGRVYLVSRPDQGEVVLDAAAIVRSIVVNYPVDNNIFPPVVRDLGAAAPTGNVSVDDGMAASAIGIHQRRGDQHLVGGRQVQPDRSHL